MFVCENVITEATGCLTTWMKKKLLTYFYSKSNVLIAHLLSWKNHFIPSNCRLFIIILFKNGLKENGEIGRTLTQKF